MKAINLVTIGYGGMGSYHTHTLVPEVDSAIRVTGVYDIDPARQKVAAEKNLFVYESLAEIWQDSQVEAVLIATPNDSHKDLALAALAAGKHVVCEKPAMMNTAELDEVLAAATRAGKTFMVHQNRRWDPDYLIVRDLYQNQPIGQIVQLESRVHGANGIPGDWRHLAKHGGGMLLDWGVHLIDQILWLVDAPLVDVKVDFSYLLGDEVDDGFVSYLTFENGVRALIEVGTTNFVKLPRWYVKGLQGTAKIDDWDLTGEVVRATNHSTVVAPSPIQAGVGLTKTMAPPAEAATDSLDLPKALAEYPSFYQNFYEVVREAGEPIVKNEQVRQVLQVMEQMLDSAKQSLQV